MSLTFKRQTLKNGQSLLGDDRGVIMVAGVFFSLLLIGLCWFIFGIGNAIAYRENLQNAADSAAFAAAVYDARGMNLLAMINIIMGVVLATLVVAKFIEIGVVLADISDCEGYIDKAEDLVPGLPEDAIAFGIAVAAVAIKCPKDCKDIKSWQNKLKNYDSGVHTALKLLHDAEVGIAVGWPWIAAGKSANVQYYYKDGQNLKKGTGVTSSFSYSQIPWSLENDVGNLLGAAPTGGAAAPNPSDTRYGLPVTSDSYHDLCFAVFDDVSTLGGAVGSNPLSGVIADVLSACGQWFCDDGTASTIPTDVIEAAPLLFGPQAVVFCAVVTNLGGLAGALKGGGFGSFENWMTPLPMSMTPPGVKKGDNTYSPMALYPKANMGLDYFGIWSTAIGDYDDTLSSGRVQIAGQQAKSGPATVAPAPEDVYVGVAKAEFYYDPQSTGETVDQETKMSLDNQPLDVMWNMRWRARLRRYHYFPGADGIGDAAIDLMNTGFANVASAAVTALLDGKNPLTSLVGPAVSVDKLPDTGAPNIFH